MLLTALLVPAAGAALIGLLGRWPNLREAVTLLTSLILFGVVLSIYGDFMDAGRPACVLAGVLPQVKGGPALELALSVEPLGMLFALVASCLWIVTSFYAIGYMRAHHEQDQTRFFACFAIAISATMGIAFARNFFTLFLFYEALTFSTYPLVTHARTDAARKSGRVYLGILVGTSVAFLLLAMLWTWFLTGTLEFTPGGILAGKVEGWFVPVLLALFMFGTGKAALMPFHRWLPAAMVAPTPVSALLHAVAVVKAGVFTVMKVSIYIFGVDFLAETGASEWLMWAAATTILLASLVAMTKDNLKARLAYSTISQLSYIVLGAALANDLGIIGGGMHIAMHAVGKITLFFCAGAIMVALHKTEISTMAGIGRRMPVTMTAFFIASVSIIGLPPCGGAWSKWYLALGALDGSRYVLLSVLLISSLLNVAYLLPIPIRAFFSKPAGGDEGEQGLKEAPLFCVVPLSVTALGCLVLFVFPGPLFELVRMLVPS
ncbi:MAG: proton-conducting transporter membrane subunit [Planctomycetota bacterium]